MAFKYSIILTSVTPPGTALTNAFAALKPATTAGAAGSVCGVSEISLSGQSASSVAFVASLQRAHSVTLADASPPTAASLSPFAPAAASTSDGATATVATGQTAVGGIIINLGFNAFGGAYRWVAPPGSEILVTTAAGGNTNHALLLFSSLGAPAISGHIIFEEL